MKTDETLVRLDGEGSDALVTIDAGGDAQRVGYGYGARRSGLGRYWRAVRRRLWVISSVTLFATFVVAVVVAQQPDYYRATARIEINPESDPDEYGSNRGGGYDPLYFSSQLQIVEGPGLLRQVVKRVDLPNSRPFFDPWNGHPPGMWDNVAHTFGASRQRPPRQTTAPPPTVVESPAPPADEDADRKESEQLAPYVSMLRGGLTVSPVKEKRLTVKDTRLVDISFTHSDPDVAAQLANAVADTYVSSNLEKRTRNSVNTGDFLKQRVNELQAQIRAGEEHLIGYARDHQIVSLDASQNTVVQRLADLNQRLAEAEHDRIVAEADFRSAGAPAAARAQADVVDSRSAALESRLSELNQKREQMRVELQDEDSGVVEVDRQIAQVQKDLADSRSRAVSNLTTNLDTKFRESAAKESELRKAFESQRDEVLSQNEASINYRIIQQEIETNKKLLDGLLQRLRENDVVLTGTPNNVALVDRALTPRYAAGPERLEFVALAFLLALAGCVGLAILRERSDDSLQTPEDVESGLLLPVLSEIPTSTPSARLALPAAFRRSPGARRSSITSNVEEFPAAKEAYLHLRTNVLMAHATHPPGTILVTSARPAEGKTTTAVNLARVLAETGASVLIIDADLRNPSLGKLFHFENERGLSSLLTEERVTGGTMRSAITHDEASRLYVLPAGPPTESPATLLCSARMRQLLDALRSRFTYIVIDSPPALLFTDASVLSSFADAVLLVVRSGQSSQEVAARARKLLVDRGARLFGVVLNDIAHPRDAYAYREQQEYVRAS